MRRVDTIAKAPGAILSSISSWGVAAAVGVAAIVAAMAAFGGFADGGYTAKGAKMQPAGVVHAGEWVAPKWMVEDERIAPVIQALEAERQGSKGFATGGLVGAPRLSDSFLRASAPRINAGGSGSMSVDGKASAVDSGDLQASEQSERGGSEASQAKKPKEQRVLIVDYRDSGEGRGNRRRQACWRSQPPESHRRASRRLRRGRGV